MGRRSTHTTKSGKFMNPTDQARKEARRKELKKNKKQRDTVRYAVLKSKDPVQLLEEALLYDRQEFDPANTTPLNERVIQEKRKKIMETFDRILCLYKKEDPDSAKNLVNHRYEYEVKRQEIIHYYENSKLAENLKSDEITLPQYIESAFNFSTSEIPLPTPSHLFITSKSILKPSKNYASGVLLLPPPPSLGNIKITGPPPGPPPELSDSDDENAAIDKQRKIRFADDKATDIAFHPGQNPSCFVPDESSHHFRMVSGINDNELNNDLQTQISLPPLPIVIGPPESMPVFQPSSVLMPTRMQMPPMQANFAMPIETIPMPPRHIVSAPPNINKSLVMPMSTPFHSLNSATVTATVIEAKPKLKNLIGDATKFVPTSIKLKRSLNDSKNKLPNAGGTNATLSRTMAEMQTKKNASDSKDEAYDAFMREMGTLL